MPNRFPRRVTIDAAGSQRRRWLQALQSDLSVRRQSDFEKSRIWRYVLVAATLIAVANLLSDDPQTRLSYRVQTKTVVA
ncbi:hypothetical protein [Burkholderia gladioli]|uniref:hypothetical protein n=1 Tax=Burkholderia gladioli TaxID=28095 RepID=UPI00163EA8DB|nr:hypothetical protein [Burkholderia gladioli]